MKKILTLIAAIMIAQFSFGQVFLNEDFNGTFPPTGWSRDGVPAQWSKSESNNAGGTPAEAKFTYTNQNTTSRLISPVIDMTGQTNVSLSFKYMYDWYANGPVLGVATRFGTGAWEVAWSVSPTGNQGPKTQIVELTNVGQSDFQFCLFISGNLYNSDYWYIDDVKLFIPLSLDAALTDVQIPQYLGANAPFELEGVVTNEGINPLTSFDVAYTVDGGEPQQYSVSGVNILIGNTYSFTHPTPIVLSEIGSHAVTTTISNINGGDDLNPDNNSITRIVGVVPFIPVKKVLAEEATGTWCPWCVRGTCFMEYMSETYPDTWIGVAVHNGDPMVYAPYDEAIGSIIPGFLGYPNVTTDRTAGDSDPSDLEAAYNRRINAISPATIDIVDFSWNPDTRVVTFDLQSEFVADVINELRFGVIVTEDSLWGTTSQWNQANAYAGGGNGPMCGFESMPSSIPASQMHYNHVARTILDTPYGTPSSLPTPIAAGSMHSYSYTLNIPETWIFEKLHFIGFLVDFNTKEILNANNVISNYVSIREISNAIQLSIYPNPAANEANIAFSLDATTNVSVEVFDVFGKSVLQTTPLMLNAGSQEIKINTTTMPQGTYLLKVTAGSEHFIRKMMVSK